MKTLHTLLATLTLGLGLISCRSHSTDDAPTPAVEINATIPTIENLSVKIDEQTTNIRTEVDTIKNNGTELENNLWEIQASVEDPTKKDLVTDSIVKANKIQDSATYITDVSLQIDKDLTVLSGVTENIKNLEKKAVELQQQQEQAKAESLKRLYSYIVVFWVVGFLVIIGGAAVAFFANKSMGFTIMMIGGIMLGFAAASQFYMKEIAQFGAFLLVGLIVTGMVIMIRSMIKQRKADTAVAEIVSMIEILKETMTDDEKNRIFGPGGVAETVHSDITKEIIAKVKVTNGHPSTFPTGTTGT